MLDKKELQEIFGKNLQRIRKEKNISGAELARRCYMDKQSLHRLEIGETNPTLFTIKRLALELEIPVEDLVRGV